MSIDTEVPIPPLPAWTLKLNGRVKSTPRAEIKAVNYDKILLPIKTTAYGRATLGAKPFRRAPFAKIINMKD
jgi:hypothetical protein